MRACGSRALDMAGLPVEIEWTVHRCAWVNQARLLPPPGGASRVHECRLYSISCNSCSCSTALHNQRFCSAGERVHEPVTEPTESGLCSSQSTMATTTTTQVVEEGKLLSENLSTVKLQAAQMRRHLVRLLRRSVLRDLRMSY